jgi:hypothetical protein
VDYLIPRLGIGCKGTSRLFDSAIRAFSIDIALVLKELL